jgi:glycine betaine/proline transport system substrate-binding protein
MASPRRSLTAPSRLHAPQLTRRSALLGGVGLAGLGLSACSGNATRGEGSGAGTITIGYMRAWTDTLCMAYLLADRLKALGNEVAFEELSDAAVVYAALAGGDIDIYSSGWPDVTHAEYMKQYGDDIEDLVTYNSNATNMLAVPEYTDIDTIEDLAEDPGRFGGRLTGIEPGAGLTGMVEDSVIPEYGLDDGFEFVTSSTPAMLSELKKATDAEKDIVVTLWRPFWAYQAFPVKALEDTEGAFGKPETMHVFGRDGFGKDFADAADYIGQISLKDEEYESLEDMVLNDFEEGEEDDAVAAWLEKNPDILPAVES